MDAFEPQGHHVEGGDDLPLQSGEGLAEAGGASFEFGHALLHYLELLVVLLPQLGVGLLVDGVHLLPEELGALLELGHAHGLDTQGRGVLVRLLGGFLQGLRVGVQGGLQALELLGVLLTLGAHFLHLPDGLGDGLPEGFVVLLRVGEVLLVLGGGLRVQLYLGDKFDYFVFQFSHISRGFILGENSPGTQIKKGQICICPSLGVMGII